ncbi:MAG: hypothetical protein Q7R70_00430 [Candidatus Diapherotrites archaeon]|nr:hypothetical protein [Candidatus Diapherotrites archaeon]
MKAKILAVIIGIFMLAFAAYAQAEAPSHLELEVLNPQSGALISQANGNYRILFKVYDTNIAADINASIYYFDSSTKAIVENLQLKTQGNCTSIDWTAKPTCYFDWNTAGINTAAQYLHTIAQDLNAGWSTTFIFGMTIDNTPPSGVSIQINNTQALTNETGLSLGLSASADANQMQFSCDNSSFTAWENFAASKALDLATGNGACNATDGNKTVYFRVKDTAGNNSAVASDSIILDTVGPTIEITQPQGNGFDNNSRRQIIASISDSLSGLKISSLKFRIDEKSRALGIFADYSLAFASDTNVLTYTPKTIDYNNGPHYIQIDLNDIAGNQATETASFNIDLNALDAITDLNGGIQGNMQITIAWTAPSLAGADLNFYKIYKSRSPVVEIFKLASYYAKTNSTIFDDSNIAKGSTYYYYVTSVDAAGNESKLSNEKTVQVQGFVQISFDKNAITLEEGTSYSIEVTVFNDTQESKNIALTASSDDGRLNAELGSTYFRLNRGERTTFSLSLIAESNVRSGDHEITIELNYDNLTVTKTIDVTVGNSDFVSFDIPDPEICNEDYTIIIPVDITNLSSNTKTISLTASNSTFMPYWDDSPIQLDPDETATTDLILNNQPANGLEGQYTIQVTARSGSNISVQDLEVNISNCNSSGSSDFSLTVDNSSIEIRKNEKRRIEYRITNNSDFDQYFHVSVETDLHTDYNSLIFVHSGDTERDFSLVSAGPFQEADKRYDYKIIVSNDDFTKEKTISVRVLPTHYFEFSASVQSLDLRQGESITIPIEFDNADYTEDFTLGIEKSDSAITTGFSEPTFRMLARESKTVNLTITAPSNAALGSRTFKITARTGSVPTKKLDLGLNITAAIPIPETTLLDIESYPTQVQLMPGQFKEITFIIYNPSSNPASTTIELSGLPDGVSLEEDIIETIQAKSRKTITAVLKADKTASTGDFEVAARIQAFGMTQTKRFNLTVGNQQQGFLSGIISGFLTLGESVWLGVLALIAIIVVLVMLGKLAGNGKPKETWVQK